MSGSVLVGAHACQHARGDGGVRGIGGAEFGRAVVAVDLPEAADAALVDRAEVVFAVRIVVGGKDIERAYLVEEHGLNHTVY